MARSYCIGESSYGEINLAGVYSIHLKKKQSKQSSQITPIVPVEVGSEAWKVGEVIIRLATSVFPTANLPSCLLLSYHPSPSCLQISSELILTYLFSLFSLTSLVSITKSMLITPKFILAVLDLSSHLQISGISTWKSHKLFISLPGLNFSPSVLILGKYKPSSQLLRSET